MKDVSSRNLKKPVDVSARAKKIQPLNSISKGSFGIIYGCGGVGIQPCSFVQVITDNNAWNIPVRGTGVFYNVTAENYFYLHITFKDGAPNGATVVRSSNWWNNFPITRMWGDNNIKKPETQTDYYLPIGYSGTYNSGRGVAISTCSKPTIVFVERLVKGDIALYYACDGWIALPAAASIPCN